VTDEIPKAEVRFYVGRHGTASVYVSNGFVGRVADPTDCPLEPSPFVPGVIGFLAALSMLGFFTSFDWSRRFAFGCGFLSVMALFHYRENKAYREGWHNRALATFYAAGESPRERMEQAGAEWEKREEDARAKREKMKATGARRAP